MAGLLDYLVSPFVVRALIGVALIAANAALSGAFANFRGTTFLVAGASHAALGGAALVIVLAAHGLSAGVSPLLGGALFAVALSMLAGYVSNRRTKEEVDTAIGVGFAFAMALAVVLISLIPEAASRVWGMLMGDLLLLNPADLWLLTGMTLVVGFTFIVFRRQFLFVTFDIEGAKAFGVRAELYNYLLFALIGLSSAVLLKAVGAIVVFAMLVAPAATALLISNSVRKVIALSFFIALGCGVTGVLASYFFEFSASALAALLAAGSYLVASGVRALADRTPAAVEEDA